MVVVVVVVLCGNASASSRAIARNKRARTRALTRPIKSGARSVTIDNAGFPLREGKHSFLHPRETLSQRKSLTTNARVTRYSFEAA